MDEAVLDYMENIAADDSCDDAAEVHQPPAWVTPAAPVPGAAARTVTGCQNWPDILTVSRAQEAEKLRRALRRLRQTCVGQGPCEANLLNGASCLTCAVVSATDTLYVAFLGSPLLSNIFMLESSYGFPIYFGNLDVCFDCIKGGVRI